jgi:autotransporter translocation and assembly factor TamB
VQFYSPALGEEGLKWLLFGKAQAGQLHITHISVVNGKLDSQNIPLPPFDAKAEIGQDGNWQKILVFPSDKSGIIELQPEGDRVRVEINADTFAVPFGAAVTLGGFTAKGTAGVGDLTLNEFDGRLLGGFVSGNAKLKWANDLSLDGELSARQIDVVQLAPGLLESGKLDGKAVYSLRTQPGTQLFAAPHMEGSFVVQQGVLLGVDLMHLIKGGGSGDKTSFSELSGNFVYDGSRLQLPKVRLGAGILSANGSAEMDKNKNIRGRFSADFKSSLGSASSGLNVSGTATAPRFAR